MDQQSGFIEQAGDEYNATSAFGIRGGYSLAETDTCHYRGECSASLLAAGNGDVYI